LKNTLIFEISKPNSNIGLSPLKDLVITNFPKLPCCDEGSFYEELQIMCITRCSQPLQHWQRGIPGKINGAPTLHSERAAKKEMIDIFF
jgi:hypothetical protein